MAEPASAARTTTPEVTSAARVRRRWYTAAGSRATRPAGDGGSGTSSRGGRRSGRSSGSGGSIQSGAADPTTWCRGPAVGWAHLDRISPGSALGAVRSDSCGRLVKALLVPEASTPCMSTTPNEWPPPSRLTRWRCRPVARPAKPPRQDCVEVVRCDLRSRAPMTTILPTGCDNNPRSGPGKRSPTRCARPSTTSERGFGRVDRIQTGTVVPVNSGALFLRTKIRARWNGSNANDNQRR